MRNIKFRGRDLTTKKFIFSSGFLRHKADETVILIEKETDEGFITSPIISRTLSQFTGFQDSKGNDIYENDILTDVVETDEGKINSSQKVFWNQFTGSWHLDNSFSQEESYSTELWLELQEFNYTIQK